MVRDYPSDRDSVVTVSSQAELEEAWREYQMAKPEDKARARDLYLSALHRLAANHGV